MGKITTPAGSTRPPTLTSLVAITLAVRRQVTKSAASTRKRHVMARLVASTSPSILHDAPGPARRRTAAGSARPRYGGGGERAHSRGRASQRRHRLHHGHGDGAPRRVLPSRPHVRVWPATRRGDRVGP